MRVKVFETALFAVVGKVFTERGYTMGAEVVSALQQLSYSYVKLKPNPEANSTSLIDNFLDPLWRMQFSSYNNVAPAPSLDLSVAALEQLLEGVEDPARAILFVNNLVQAATNVESLNKPGQNGELPATQEAQFLRELVAFGFEYAKLNPTQVEGATENGTEAFLATLWQSMVSDSTAVRQATGKLDGLFAGVSTTEERLKILKFGTNSLKAIGLSNELQIEKQDSKFLSALIELGGAYAALKPTTNSTEPLNFFLNTLWIAQDETDFQNGVEELSSFVQNFDDPTQLIDYQYKLLTTLKLVPVLQDVIGNPSFVKDMVFKGKTYTALELEPEHQYAGFLPDVWKAASKQELKDVANVLQGFILNPNNNYDLYASTMRPGPAEGPEFNRCYDLLQMMLVLIEGGVDSVFGVEKGLRTRYYEMQIDELGLYRAHVEAVQGYPQAEQSNVQQGLGTWTGHRERYNRLRQRLREIYDEFKNICSDDDDDRYHYGTFIPGIDDLLNDAEAFPELEPPNQPRPNQIFLPNWLVRLGGVVSEGTLVVRGTAGALSGFALRALQVITEAYGLILRFSQ